MALTTLQNPVKSRLEAINTDLKDVNKAQKGFGKALDKVPPPRCNQPDSLHTVVFTDARRRPSHNATCPWKQTPWPTSPP
jgi:hypothetical protein